MLNASQNAVDFMSGVSAGDDKDQSIKNDSITNIQSLKDTIQKAKANLSMEEINIRDSIETFEKEFNQTHNNRKDVMGSMVLQGEGIEEESKGRLRMNQSQGSVGRQSQESGCNRQSIDR